VYETLDPVRNYKQQIGEKLLCDTFFCMEDSGGVGSDRIGGVVAVAYQLLHKHMAGVNG